jgi:Cu/Zn superoxide dismutase
MEHAKMDRMDASIRLFAATALAAALAACATTKEQWEARMEEPALVAQLRSPSSAATGAVHVYNTKDGVQVQLVLNNLAPGAYRVALHERNNCSSPNLFSAGPAWAPASWTKPAAELLPGFSVGDVGNETGYVAYVKGIKADGPELRTKSIVVHWGNLVGEAFPGQPNNRIACGVFQASRPLAY